MSAAGEALGVTHTTVGRRLRSIETQLGVRLFERTPEGCVPTEAGRDLTSVAERVDVDLKVIEARIRGRDSELSGPLDVSTLDILFQRYRPIFASFAERYPAIELRMSTTTDEVVLSRRDADIVLRMSNTPPEYLVGRKVGRMEFAVYGARDLVAQAGPEPRYSDLPWLHWVERMNYKWLDYWLAENAPGARVALRIDNNLVMQQALEAGIGVHFLPIVQGDAHGDLTRVGPALEGYGRDVWLLTLRDLRSNSRVRVFMDHFREELG